MELVPPLLLSVTTGRRRHHEAVAAMAMRDVGYRGRDVVRELQAIITQLNVIHGSPPATGGALALTRRETAAKQRAIEACRSQTLVIGDFMRTFETGRERFVEGAPLPQPPCCCRGENVGTP